MSRILLIVSIIFCSACSSSELSLVEETDERQFKYVIRARRGNARTAAMCARGGTTSSGGLLSSA